MPTMTVSSPRSGTTSPVTSIRKIHNSATPSSFESTADFTLAHATLGEGSSGTLYISRVEPPVASNHFASTTSQLFRYSPSKASIWSLHSPKLSPSSIVLAHSRGTTLLHDWDLGVVRTNVSPDGSDSLCCSSDPIGRTIVSGLRDGRVEVRDTRSPLNEQSGGLAAWLETSVTSVHMLECGDRILATTMSGQVGVFDVRRMAPSQRSASLERAFHARKRPRGAKGPVQVIAFQVAPSENGTNPVRCDVDEVNGVIAVVSPTRNLEVFSLSSGSLLASRRFAGISDVPSQAQDENDVRPVVRLWGNCGVVGGGVVTGWEEAFEIWGCS
ncbi:hypothetical protein M427DRAFT_70160 [Gonapodya prolifera JEL478]|uniref:WD40 repeat-like protein n=1 Tax=Gonapodya prolifera (strain JEL478) TaxID=1344416 RepID=A0A139AF48_GONPJ|nr:hypothetical protein M427DRAFT_70160 [Gonapodya prolifera JEL478]|eukprot:KXS15055.1 hypothetical protein M427DRAFT_70160 [Gonapodya prolifera JEL478]